MFLVRKYLLGKKNLGQYKNNHYLHGPTENNIPIVLSYNETLNIETFNLFEMEAYGRSCRRTFKFTYPVKTYIG